MDEARTMRIAAVVVAAGRGQRLGPAALVAGGKGFVPVGGVPLVVHSTWPLAAHPAIGTIVWVVAADKIAGARAMLQALAPRKRCLVAAGGATRPESVYAGLQALYADPAGRPDVVLIHDAARPFVPQELLERVIAAAVDYGAVAPAVPVVDTLKEIAVKGEDGGDDQDGSRPPVQRVLRTWPRDHFRQVQTPQGFRFDWLWEAYQVALGGPTTGPASGAGAQPAPESVTDDCMLVEMQGRPVYLVEGDAGNRKITVPADLAWAEARLRDEQSGRRLGAPADGGAWRVGSGYDIHRLVEGRRLVLGGVEIPWERGLLGHSDADVLLHAAMDAILGAMAAGDIGRHFPDTSPEWAGADSAAMLRKVVQMMKDQGWQVENLDATVIAQQPRLGPYAGAMRERMAGLLEVEPARVGIKAKTNEGLDAVGRGEAIAAQAVVLLRGRKGA